MEKYLKLGDVIEELGRLVRTKQIEPIHINLDQMEENFQKMSIKSISDFEGIVQVTQRMKREYEILLDNAEKGESKINPVYLQGHLDVLDEIEDELKELKEKNNPLDLLVMWQKVLSLLQEIKEEIEYWHTDYLEYDKENGWQRVHKKINILIAEFLSTYRSCG